MKTCDFTPLEQKILEQSTKPEITRKRRIMVIASGLCFAVILIAASLIMRSWQFVLGIALFYIAITILEKIVYANVVLAYKSLIQKLKKQVEYTESEEHSKND